MRHRTYAAYIMSSLSRTLYTGVTNNLERRVFEHKERRPGSFTARYNVNRLVYFEEKEIKSMTRRRKIRWIESMHPQWRFEPGMESGATRVRDSLARQPRAGMTNKRHRAF
jgi:putative endonuclease